MTSESDGQITTSPPLGSTPPRRGVGRVLRLTVQILGCAIGIGLLGWCVSIALRPSNRAALKQLQTASAMDIALLIGLSIIVLLASGGAFRETLRPIKRLPMLDVQATNVIACLLALLPFKLSVFFRVLVHNRRDGVPVLTIGAWFGAVGVVILCVLLPMIGASVWRGKADDLWFITSGGGMLAMLLTVLLVARTFRSEEGWAWAQRSYAKLPLPRSIGADSKFATTFFEKSHEGVRMLAAPRVVFGCALLRVIDIGAQAGRIAVAAAIVDSPLHWEQALLAGSSFFLIGAAAPTGALGVREAGTASLLTKFLPGIAMETFATIVLTVTAVEAIVMIVGSIAAGAYLRPDRLMRGKTNRRAGEREKE